MTPWVSEMQNGSGLTTAQQRRAIARQHALRNQLLLRHGVIRSELLKAGRLFALLSESVDLAGLPAEAKPLLVRARLESANGGLSAATLAGLAPLLEALTLPDMLPHSAAAYRDEADRVTREMWRC